MNILVGFNCIKELFYNNFNSVVLIVVSMKIKIPIRERGGAKQRVKV